MGAERFCGWIRKQRPLLITDTTYRDAHQSLLATRVRTYDMLAIADLYARRASTLFSIEMWGGATFDSAMRFLKESPWDRLTALRERIPNVLFQMLLRGANGVGYGTYPDNVVRAFVAESASAGIDLFRIFDALNYLPNMKAAMGAVRKTDALCEAAICYTGDILDPDRSKYSLDYYVELARELEKMGAHLLCIKDMAGLCKPYAAERLVKTLRQETDLPIHFHTHDSAGVQAAAILKAAEAGLDIADAASGPLSGMTSQPILEGVVEALRFTKRDTGLDGDALQEIAEYWEAARDFYQPFEAGMRAASAAVYRHEMPGGQTTNLRQQAAALGLASRWKEICRAYEASNRLLGDVVKVTPSSKAIGDLALFLVTNNLTADAILTSERELAFPDSVVELVAGGLGQPPGGFPPKVRRRILRGRKPTRGRPGAGLPAADLKAVTTALGDDLGHPASRQDVLSHLMFPKVFAEFSAYTDRYSDVSVLPTPAFLYGLEPGEETVVEIERGKTLLIRLVAIGEPNDDGIRTVFFELNGQPRHVTVQDQQLTGSVAAHVQADPADPTQIAAAMPGLVTAVTVKAGDRVSRGEKLLSLEAMKMETSIYAERDGEIAEVLVHPGTQVAAGDLVIRLA
jgi:pyruvate carboxylase